MRQSRSRATGKGKDHSFVQFPHYMLDSPAFLGLKPRAVKALMYLAKQYRGSNNGDLQATIKLACKAGWRSGKNLQASLRELQDTGFIVMTRQGGRNRCSLFALAWFPIDHCDGKLDVSATRVAPNDWRWPNGENCTPPGGQLAPPGGQSARNQRGRTPH